MFELATAALRWSRTREMMERLDLDVLVAIDLSRDEILLGHQRWLTGFIAMGGPAAALFTRDGVVELISERIGKPVTEHYHAHDFPIALVNGFSPKLVAERVGRHRPKRVGIAEAETLSWPIARAMATGPTPPELVDVSIEMLSLRMRKSAEEIALIRRAAAIADDVFCHVGDIMKVGRANCEVAADIDHLCRLRGSEGGFHLVLRLPFLGRPMRSTANPERIAPDTRYLIEISPRVEGYYAQLTLPVTTMPGDHAARRAYEDVVASKEAALPMIRPGVELAEVGRFVAAFLAKRGRKMASPSLGHFCGMALEEPRHDPGSPLVLEDGMTMIFHPVLSDPHLHSMMRADTYLITTTGAEQLTRYDGGLLTVA